MKIKAVYEEGVGQIRIPCILKSPHKRIVSNFIFDTGSKQTILNYTDSLRLLIPHVNKSELIRMGGKVYQSYIYDKFEILFKGDNNEIIIEDIPIRFLKPCSQKVVDLEILDFLPNLLGLDFLEGSWKFFCDLKNRNIYFEKE